MLWSKELLVGSNLKWISNEGSHLYFCRIRHFAPELYQPFWTWTKKPIFRTPIGGNFFQMLVHTLMNILTKFQLYSILFGVRPLFFSETTGLLFEFNSKFYKQISWTSIDWNEACPSVCLYFYGPHWNGIFEGTRYMTLVLEEIYWWHFFHMGRKWRQLGKNPWGPQ